ncbi:MAG: hypothetical protein IE936_09715 [Moraxella osloensis]|nr:hypothetical protein [Moraxella osloensis]
MRQVRKKLDSFTGGGYSNTFKQQLDVGMTIDEIVLNVTNIDTAQIEEIEINLNGDPIVSVDGQHLKDLHAHLGKPAETGRFRVPFKDVSLKTDQGQIMTSLVTLPTDNLVLKIKVGAVTSAQSTANAVPSVSGYMFLSAGRPRVFLPRIKREYIAIGMTGENNVKTIPTGPAIRRMFLLDGGRISRLRIKRDNMEILDADKADNEADLKYYGLQPVTGQFVFSPIMTGWGVMDMLKTANSKLELLPTVTEAGDMAVIMHTIEVAGNPGVDPLSVLLTQAKV